MDVDQLGCAFGEVEAFGHHQRDGVTDEAHLVIGQRWRGVSGLAGPIDVCHCS